MRLKLFYLSVIFWLVVSISFAQQSITDVRKSTYSVAFDLFQKQQYTAALALFDKVENLTDAPQLEKMYAAYYGFICSIELYANDSKFRGQQFIVKYPESPLINQVNFRLANYEYQNKYYKNAIDYFANINKNDLNDDDQAEFYFKYGYSCLMIDSLEKARLLFYEIKDIDTRFSSAALYYYAYIAYKQKNYETAIENFNRLKDDETFASIVPYYITHCYYYQGKYDELLAYAPSLLDSVVETRVAEMSRMIADAYFKKNSFREAIPYYERYLEKEKKLSNVDYYPAAYCYFKVDSIDKAIPLFEKAANDNTEIGQNASYHLAYCYLSKNMKDKALLAFQAASKMEYNVRIKEDAFFNYAVLSYELSNSPFNNSIKALSDYISEYPDSRRTEEAYNYLITACLNTHNYQEALNYLEKVKNKDSRIKKAYQRAAFFRALELFNNLDFEKASKLLELSLRYAASDPILAARANYWLGEIAYRKKDIDEALDNYLLFSNAVESKKTDEYAMVPYNIGYCYFNKKDYSIAATWFQKFIANRVKNNQLNADAYNRLGDCAFVATRYNEAITFYNKSIEIGAADKDYAIFQKAFAIGLTGNHQKKIQQLKQLLNTMPNSTYCDDALFEIGQSYMALQMSSEAINYFRKIIVSYSQSSYVKKAWLQLGLIDYNSNRFDSALVKYKKVINDYPNTTEARSALNGIKNIYIEQNDIDAYLKLTESLGVGSTDKAQKDSLMYYAAENQYTAQQWINAIEGFKKYITTFPDGNFKASAYYYLADCEIRTGQFIDALKHLNVITAMPRNNYTELAHLRAAQLNLDKKDFYAALRNFQALDSIAESSENIVFTRQGLVICNYNLGKFQETIDAANKFLDTPNLSQENERIAYYSLAKSYMALNEINKAIDLFRKLAKDVKNKEGAEAKYLLAEIYFKQNTPDKSMKEIFQFIDLNTPHQYWIAKAYILLAQIYWQKKNTFQALKTLESIIENYDVPDDGIIQEAKDLKFTIEGNSKEKKVTKSKSIENDSDEINF